MAGVHVGEMAVIDPSAKRSATVRAIDEVVAARVSEADFSALADKSPRLWRELSLVIAERLREREKFLPAPNIVPVVFIGSSAESLEVAEELRREINAKSTVDTRIWTRGVFGASRFPIEVLRHSSYSPISLCWWLRRTTLC